MFAYFIFILIYLNFKGNLILIKLILSIKLIVIIIIFICSNIIYSGSYATNTVALTFRDKTLLFCNS